MGEEWGGEVMVKHSHLTVNCLVMHYYKAIIGNFSDFKNSVLKCNFRFLSDPISYVYTHFIENYLKTREP